ncbi:MAG: response regulator transcription factor [Armatimonadota bacterium]
MSGRSPAGSLRVLIVADDALARAGLFSLIADQPGAAIVGQTSANPHLDASVAASNPDVLVWDLGLETRTALDRLRRLEVSTPPVLALLPERTDAAAILASGARGCLARDVDGVRLMTAARALAEGLLVIDPDVAPMPLSRDLESLSLAEHLTPREIDVLQLLAEGLANKTIGQRLGISEHTVRFHVNAILGKLGARSRTDAVTRAARAGLIIL